MRRANRRHHQAQHQELNHSKGAKRLKHSKMMRKAELPHRVRHQQQHHDHSQQIQQQLPRQSDVSHTYYVSFTTNLPEIARIWSSSGARYSHSTTAFVSISSKKMLKNTSCVSSDHRPTLKMNLKRSTSHSRCFFYRSLRAVRQNICVRSEQTKRASCACHMRVRFCGSGRVCVSQKFTSMH